MFGNGGIRMNRYKINRRLAKVLAVILLLVTVGTPITSFAETGSNASNDTGTTQEESSGRIASLVPPREIPVESISFTNITDNELFLEEGSTFNPTLLVAPANAWNKEYTVESEDEDIVSVDEDDVLHAESVGTTRIIYEADDNSGVSARIWVKVVKKVKKVTRLTLKTTSKTIYAKRYFMLKAVVRPRKATNKKLSYSSSNTKVAKVSKKGKIRGLKPGTAVITVKTIDGSNISATCTVTVIKE